MWWFKRQCVFWKYSEPDCFMKILFTTKGTRDCWASETDVDWKSSLMKAAFHIKALLHFKIHFRKYLPTHEIYRQIVPEILVDWKFQSKRRTPNIDLWCKELFFLLFCKRCNLCKWRHLVTKVATNESGATWWPNLQLMQMAPPGA